MAAPSTEQLLAQAARAFTSSPEAELGDPYSINNVAAAWGRKKPANGAPNHQDTPLPSWGEALGAFTVASILTAPGKKKPDGTFEPGVIDRITKFYVQDVSKGLKKTYQDGFRTEISTATPPLPSEISRVFGGVEDLFNGVLPGQGRTERDHLNGIYSAAETNTRNLYAGLWDQTINHGEPHQAEIDLAERLSGMIGSTPPQELKQIILANVFGTAEDAVLSDKNGQVAAQYRQFNQELAKLRAMEQPDEFFISDPLTMLVFGKEAKEYDMRNTMWGVSPMGITIDQVRKDTSADAPLIRWDKIGSQYQVFPATPRIIDRLRTTPPLLKPFFKAVTSSLQTGGFVVIQNVGSRERWIMATRNPQETVNHIYQLATLSRGLEDGRLLRDKTTSDRDMPQVKMIRPNHVAKLLPDPLVLKYPFGRNSDQSLDPDPALLAIDRQKQPLVNYLSRLCDLIIANDWIDDKGEPTRLKHTFQKVNQAIKELSDDEKRVAALALPAPKNNQSETKPELNPNVCMKCGAPLPEGSSTCSHCTVNYHETACPRCGAPKSGHLCDYCGEN
jgi:hypothetical protein